MTDAPHLPVMLHETLEGLDVRAGRWYVDGTFGAGGHSRAIVGAGGNVLGIDQDPLARTYLGDVPTVHGAELRFAAGNFRDLDRLATEAGLDEVHGVLLDLGISSMQIDDAGRGFAFRQDGPLDMRMSSVGESAADVVNGYGAEELAEIIFRYGEERHSRRIARRIVEARERAPIATTAELAELIASAYPGGYRRDHPARRTFQALRIHVNDELGALQDALAASERILAPGGRLVVIAYHSLEDRIVKHWVRGNDRFDALTKRPLEARDDEVEANPRARSAKLRVALRRPDEAAGDDAPRKERTRRPSSERHDAFHEEARPFHAQRTTSSKGESA